MYTLIHENQETSSSIECWQRKEIEDSETQRNHSNHDEYCPSIDIIFYHIHKDFPDSHWTPNTIFHFFFLRLCRCVREAGYDNRSKGTERKSNLMIDFRHSIKERLSERISVFYQSNMRSDKNTYFTRKRDHRNLKCVCLSQNCEYIALFPCSENTQDIIWSCNAFVIYSSYDITCLKSCCFSNTPSNRTQ